MTLFGSLSELPFVLGMANISLCESADRGSIADALLCQFCIPKVPVSDLLLWQSPYRYALLIGGIRCRL